jgi:hypothetical protein
MLFYLHTSQKKMNQYTMYKICHKNSYLSCYMTTARVTHIALVIKTDRHTVMLNEPIMALLLKIISNHSK